MTDHPTPYPPPGSVAEAVAWLARERFLSDIAVELDCPDAEALAVLLAFHDHPQAAADLIYLHAADVDRCVPDGYHSTPFDVHARLAALELPPPSPHLAWPDTIEELEEG